MKAQTVFAFRNVRVYRRYALYVALIFVLFGVLFRDSSFLVLCLNRLVCHQNASIQHGNDITADDLQHRFEGQPL